MEGKEFKNNAHVLRKKNHSLIFVVILLGKGSFGGTLTEGP